LVSITAVFFSVVVIGLALSCFWYPTGGSRFAAFTPRPRVGRFSGDLKYASFPVPPFLSSAVCILRRLKGAFFFNSFSVGAFFFLNAPLVPFFLCGQIWNG